MNPRLPACRAGALPVFAIPWRATQQNSLGNASIRVTRQPLASRDSVRAPEGGPHMSRSRGSKGRVRALKPVPFCGRVLEPLVGGIETTELLAKDPPDPGDPLTPLAGGALIIPEPVASELKPIDLSKTKTQKKTPWGRSRRGFFYIRRCRPTPTADPPSRRSRARNYHSAMRLKGGRAGL